MLHTGEPNFWQRHMSEFAPTPLQCRFHSYRSPSLLALFLDGAIGLSYIALLISESATELFTCALSAAMSRLSRSTFRQGVRALLLQAWNPPHANNAPRRLLPLTYDWLADDLPAPNTTGLLFEFLYYIAVALPAYLLQGASPLDASIYMEDVSAFVSEYGVATGFNLDMPFEIYLEMDDLFVDIMKRMYWGSTDAEDLEKRRFEILTSDCTEAKKVEKFRDHMWGITMVYLQVLIETHVPLFRRRWTALQYADFANGFVAGLDSGVSIPMRLLPEPDMNPIDFEQFYLLDPDGKDADRELELCEVEYMPTGPRIPLDTFCQPVFLIDVPRDEICTICGMDVPIFDVGDEAVVTACRHRFHAECLASWVNDSAVSSANTCPDCREVMCEARSRKPVEGSSEHRHSGEVAGDELGRYILQLRRETTLEKPARSDAYMTACVELEDLL